jgi:energy-coupling factor transport system ATP-binding protein
MIEFDRVTVTYPDADTPVLRDVSLRIAEGELCLVVGATGVGKSTLLGAVNGLVPHFTGGRLAGEVRVGGLRTSDHPPRDLSHLVGVVGQDPLSGFVTDTVEDELAYTMEQLGVAPDVMRKRVEETLDLLGLADLRRRALHDLSGGQQQRVAIGAALTSHPKVLVLDEPTSALDPTAAEDVLAAITRIVHDLGVTVLLAEHRLERVVQYADRVIHLPGDGTAVAGDPADIFVSTSIAPPVVELGRLLEWSPLPMSVRDARRRAGPVRDRLANLVPAPRTAPAASPPVLSARGVVVRYGDTTAVRGVDLELQAGTVTALMGRNGSGKSSLLWAIQGTGRRQAGAVEAPGLVGLVPQTPADLLYLDTVRAELELADRSAASGESARELLDRIAPGIDGRSHPRDLSEGQRLALVLAIQLRSGPEVVLLDEPTRGLDYLAKAALRDVLRDLALRGHAVVVATHDVEFVASTADRVVVMGDGDIVADGMTADVVVASPAFAPQVAKILAPLEFLTVEAVEAALAKAAG